MEATPQTKLQLTKREIQQIMADFEDESDVETDANELEDVTDFIMDSVQHLTGTQMLCRPGLDLADTMSCFEVMDPKMDSRMHRKTVMTVPKAQAAGILVKPCEMSVNQKHALFQEFLV